MQSIPITELSIVIAVFNEKENISFLLAEVAQALNLVEKFEIIVVDDGSQDGTKQELEVLQQKYAHLRVISHSRNYGQSIAIINGVRAATYNWVITLDGDGQNDPADFNKLLLALPPSINFSQPILIAGNRIQRNDSWMRRFSSKIANYFRSRLLNDDCPDSGCGLKLFSRTGFLQLPHFNHIHRFLPALFTRANGMIINVPVNHRPRTRGQSKYGVMNRLWIGIIDLCGVMWLIRRPCWTQFDDR